MNQSIHFPTFPIWIGHPRGQQNFQRSTTVRQTHHFKINSIKLHSDSWNREHLLVSVITNLHHEEQEHVNESLYLGYNSPFVYLDD